MNMKFSVLSPMGQHVGKGKSIVPRLPDLKGKTVCEVWNGMFRGDVMFPVIRQLLEKHYPDMKIIPYNEFPILHPAGNTDQLCESLKETILEKACDAVISGVGG